MSIIKRVLSIQHKAAVCNSFIQFSRPLGTKAGYDDPNILKSESSDIVIPDLTINELIYPKLEQYHKYTHVECASTGRSYTFGQIRTKSSNFSKALREKLKLRRGDVVAILSKNVPEFSIATFGILEAGLVVTTLNPAYTSEEIKTQLLDSGATAIVTHIDTFSTVKSSLKMMNSRMPIMVIKDKQADSLPAGVIDFHEFSDTTFDVPDIEPGRTSDLAFLPYSSGTTGMPKGVELTHNNIVANILQANHEDFVFLVPPSETVQDVIPGVLPLYHIYGFTICAMNSAYNGAKVVTLEKFTPDLYVSVLQNHRVSVLYGAPPLVLFMTTHQGVKKEYFKSMRLVISGAAPLGLLDEQSFINKVGSHVKIRQGYGLTETSPMVTWFPRATVSSEKMGGSIGKLAPNTIIKIIDPDDITGTPLGMNKTGELLVRGPQVTRGYHNRPEETKNSFLDGWFRTGDLAHYNDEGYLFISDRLKELIKVKGFQVAPAELEALIRNFPGVEDAAVIGIPHATHGEVPRAYVVPEKGTFLNIEELREHLAQKVAKYKQLAGGVKILDAIPKNPSGKILRRQLKEDYIERGV